GVLEPVARLAGIANQDQVGPTVAVEVFGPAGEAVAVAGHAVAVVAQLADLVHLPIGGLVPGLAGENVHLAVAVDIGDGHAFGAEDLVDYGLFPGDPAVVLGGIGGGQGGEKQGRQQER